jgi:hypothetical protein
VTVFVSAMGWCMVAMLGLALRVACALVEHRFGDRLRKNRDAAAVLSKRIRGYMREFDRTWQVSDVEGGATSDVVTDELEAGLPDVSSDDPRTALRKDGAREAVVLARVQSLTVVVSTARAARLWIPALFIGVPVVWLTATLVHYLTAR